MPIDPIVGGISGAVGAGVRAQQNKRYDEKMRQMSKEHSETMARASYNQYEKARRSVGEGVPLGWLNSGLPGNCVQCYFTKEEYLYNITHPGMFRPIFDYDLYGWNKEWGDCKTECAKARRAYHAEQNPERAKEILASPLENYYFNLPHWETPTERWEKQKQKEKEDNERFLMTSTVCFLIIALTLIAVLS